MFVKSCTLGPSCYPRRLVSNDGVYAPVEFTHSSVEENAEDNMSGKKWADVFFPVPSVLGKRKTFHGGGIEKNVEEVFEYDSKRQRYKFPVHTGICGRGLLGRFGPNHAADPVVTRQTADGKMEVVLIRRRDCGLLAFPGGMVDPGQNVPHTLKNEFSEEAAKPGGAVDRIFSDHKVATVFRGIVDDPRNTDEAWIETTCVHFHTPNELSKSLDMKATDVKEVRRHPSPVEFYVIGSPRSVIGSRLVLSFLRLCLAGGTISQRYARTKSTPLTTVCFNA